MLWTAVGRRWTHVTPASSHLALPAQARPAAAQGITLPLPRASSMKLLGKEGCSSCPQTLPFPSHLHACACKRSGNLAGWNEERSQGSGAETNCSRSAPWELHQKGNRSWRTRCLFHGASQHRPRLPNRQEQVLHRDGPSGLCYVLQRPFRELWFHFPALKRTDQGHHHFFKVLKFPVPGRVTTCRHGDKRHNAVREADCQI